MLALITTFFNPCGYSRPVENYFRFREALGGLPLFTVELSFDGTFIIPDSIRIQADRETQTLWQKERLINLATVRIPAAFDKIAWLDCDVLFLNRDWYLETARKLELFEIVQMFDTAHWLDAAGRVERSRPSSARYGSYMKHGTDESHPGFAWAARRELLNNLGGLIDRDVTGNADALMALMIFQEYEIEMLKFCSPGLRRDVMKWGDRLPRHEKRVGVVPGDLLHLYHGTIANRKYWQRFLIQRDHRFEPSADIKVGNNGAWMWSTPKPEFHAAVAGCFQARKEDD